MEMMMTAREYWNYIVVQHEKNCNALESVVQEEWEGFFSEIFGYKKIWGEIDSKRTIRLGTQKYVIPDIIIKENGNDLFNVELKQYRLLLNSDMEGQLKSYMDLLHISIGVIVCSKLYIYFYT